MKEKHTNEMNNCSEEGEKKKQEKKETQEYNRLQVFQSFCKLMQLNIVNKVTEEKRHQVTHKQTFDQDLFAIPTLSITVA